MTVETTTSRVQYDTNGTTGPWSVPFYFLEDSHLSVIYTDSASVETTLALSVGYTVSGAGDPAGGYVTTTTGYAAGGSVTILRNVPATQETDYVETDSFPAEAHERALDKLTMIAQQLRDGVNSALRVPETADVLPTFPVAASRASRLAAFDASGNPTVSVPADQSAASLALILASYTLTSEGSGIVGHNPDLTYPANTVGYQLGLIKTLPDFGAVGDGVTDDSAAIQAAITAYGGRVIDGLGRTYKCDSVLTGITSGTTLRNMTLDFSGVSTASAKYIYAAGTASATQTLSANLAVDAVTVSVPSTASFVAEGWAWLQSTAVWSSVDGTYFGQYVKVKSVDSGTQLTLYQGPIMAFNTADAATIQQITTVSNVEFHSVHIIGSGANLQSAIYLYLAEECLVANTCSVTFADYVGVNLARSVNCKAQPTVKHARAIGLAYGIVISQGSFGCTVDDGYGEDVRHYVSVGDNDGVNINCRATNNVVMYCTSAGIDSHVASFNFIAQGNQIVLASGASAEGITLQGLNGQAIENTVRGVTGVGIFMQPLVTASGYKNKGVARGNHVHLKDGTAGTPIGVYFQNEATAGTDWEAGDMDGNFVYGGAGSTGSIHFYILANKSAGEVKNITVRGNISVHDSLSQALYIRALGTNSVVSSVVATGNVLKTSGTRAVYVLADGTGSSVGKVVVNGNTIDGGSSATVSITASPGAVAGFAEGDNIYTSGAGSLFVITGSPTDLRLTTARRSTPSTITGATGATVPYTDTYIFNYAGTVTFTLASAAMFVGREIMLRTITANAVNSASSDVVPLDSATAGTAILSAADGAWAILKSDGTNWQKTAGS